MSLPTTVTMILRVRRLPELGSHPVQDPRMQTAGMVTGQALVQRRHAHVGTQRWNEQSERKAKTRIASFGRARSQWGADAGSLNGAMARQGRHQGRRRQ